MRTYSLLFVVAFFIGTVAQSGSAIGQDKAAAAPVDEKRAEMPEQIKTPDDLRLKQASFTFVRVQYGVAPEGAAAAVRGRARSGGGGHWMTDYPESELNFIRHFQNVTGLKSEPDGKVLKLTDPELKNYPFLYMVEGGFLRLSPEEAQNLRDFLLGGGFLMIDDFWGDAQWQQLTEQFKLVFPDREPKELEIDHPIFHSFYDFKVLPQVLTFTSARAQRAGSDIIENSQPPRYLGLTNDDGRLMVLFCHNNDLGDGWEREGYDEFYAKEFSQKRAYPMGINIVVYALQHAQAQ